MKAHSRWNSLRETCYNFLEAKKLRLSTGGTCGRWWLLNMVSEDFAFPYPDHFLKVLFHELLWPTVQHQKLFCPFLPQFFIQTDWNIIYLVITHIWYTSYFNWTTFYFCKFRNIRILECNLTVHYPLCSFTHVTFTTFQVNSLWLKIKMFKARGYGVIFLLILRSFHSLL